MASRKGGGFEERLEEANSHDLFRRLAGCKTSREDAPHDSTEGKPEARRDYLKDEVVGPQTDNVASGKDRIDLIELLAVELEVFFHSREVGIGEVGPTNERKRRVSARKVRFFGHTDMLRCSKSSYDIAAGLIAVLDTHLLR